MAHELVRYGRSDKYYKNDDMENTFEIARRLNIKSVQRYLIQQQKEEQDKANQEMPKPTQVSPQKPLQISPKEGKKDQDQDIGP